MTKPTNIELHLFQTRDGDWRCRADSSAGRTTGPARTLPVSAVRDALWATLYRDPSQTAEEAAGVTHAPSATWTKTAPARGPALTAATQGLPTIRSPARALSAPNASDRRSLLVRITVH